MQLFCRYKNVILNGKYIACCLHAHELLLVVVNQTLWLRWLTILLGPQITK